MKFFLNIRYLCACLLLGTKHLNLRVKATNSILCASFCREKYMNSFDYTKYDWPAEFRKMHRKGEDLCIDKEAEILKIDRRRLS